MISKCFPVLRNKDVKEKDLFLQTDNQGDCIKNLGISSATFEFQDVKCGDFIDNMSLT